MNLQLLLSSLILPLLVEGCGHSPPARPVPGRTGTQREPPVVVLQDERTRPQPNQPSPPVTSSGPSSSTTPRPTEAPPKKPSVNMTADAPDCKRLVNAGEDVSYHCTIQLRATSGKVAFRFLEADGQLFEEINPGNAVVATEQSPGEFKFAAKPGSKLTMTFQYFPVDTGSMDNEAARLLNKASLTDRLFSFSTTFDMPKALLTVTQGTCIREDTKMFDCTVRLNAPNDEIAYHFIRTAPPQSSTPSNEKALIMPKMPPTELKFMFPKNQANYQATIMFRKSLPTEAGTPPDLRGDQTAQIFEYNGIPKPKPT